MKKHSQLSICLNTLSEQIVQNKNPLPALQVWVYQIGLCGAVSVSDPEQLPQCQSAPFNEIKTAVIHKYRRLLTKNRSDSIACRSPARTVAPQFGLTAHLGYFVKEKLDAIGLGFERT
ncbi:MULTISPECIES: hypothetical protein [Aerosakkonema]|uniref:hypothetical protein n=1 Tax=Aerosakkonema TaxID=1246629 RepID=UPI0035B9F3D2